MYVNLKILQNMATRSYFFLKRNTLKSILHLFVSRPCSPLSRQRIWLLIYSILSTNNVMEKDVAILPITFRPISIS